MKPYEGMRLRYKSKQSGLDGLVAIARKDANGRWYAEWVDNQWGSRSASGSGSGIDDDGLAPCWEPADAMGTAPTRPSDLKGRNTAPDATICAHCGERLRDPMPWLPCLKHCQIGRAHV